MAYARQKWTASALAVETGMDRRIVAETLSHVEPCEVKTDSAGRETRYYWGRDAFPALYGREHRVSPRDARESAQARKIELEIAAIERRTVDLDAAVDAWNDAVSQVNQRAQGFVSTHPELEAEFRELFDSIAELPDVLVRRVPVSDAADGHGVGGPAPRTVS